MEYDVCLSFAGSERSYVSEVAALLRAQGVSCFYDDDEQSRLWGKNLYEFFAAIYGGEAARYCVIFISEEYARRNWTVHERRSAQARALRERSEYILPARFDDTELPGLLPTVGSVDLRRLSAAELVQLITQKLEMPLAIDGETSFRPRYVGEHALSDGSRLASYQRISTPAYSMGGAAFRTLAAVEERVRLTQRPDGSWTFGGETFEERVYVTSVVFAYLLQAGLSRDDGTLLAAREFLTSALEPSIDRRAAYIALAPISAVSDVDLAAFLSTLEESQIVDGRSPDQGSFLLPQPGSSSTATTHWEERPLHRSGASFHACHLADFILHIPAHATESRVVAERILARIRAYLARTISRHDGFLPDLRGQRSPVTLFAYALFPHLSLPLPLNWRACAESIFEELAGADMYMRSLGVMNAAYIALSVPDPSYRPLMTRFLEHQLRDLSLLSGKDLPVREVSTTGRALLYALAVMDPAALSLAQAGRSTPRMLDPQESST